MSDNGFQATLKSLDTEEHIDIYFYRRLGYLWARIAARLGITPNAITIASIFIGIGTGLCLLSADIWVNLAGLLLLVLANSFDSADGQLARMTGQYSRLGRILDGMAGDFWFVSIYVCICIRVSHTSPYFIERPWLVWVMAVAAGACHALQAAMADYYRQLHLQCINGKSELEDSAELKQNLAQAKAEGKSLLSRLVMTSYLNYTLNQERMTPQMQRLRVALKQRFGSGDMVPRELRDRFRSMSLPLMKYTNILSFNWRSITLLVAVLIRMPWLYFVAELVIFNGILIYMVSRHESICRKMTKEVETWR